MDVWVDDTMYIHDDFRKEGEGFFKRYGIVSRKENLDSHAKRCILSSFRSLEQNLTYRNDIALLMTLRTHLPYPTNMTNRTDRISITTPYPPPHPPLLSARLRACSSFRKPIYPSRGV